MKAIAIDKLKNELFLTDVDLSVVDGDEVLVKTLATGICSTDRELLAYQEIIPPEGYDFLVIGHEAVGEVVQIGSSVSQLQKGDLVVPTVRRGCNECSFCNSERSDMCSTGRYKERGILGLHGFMSEYFVEKEINLVKIPQTIKGQAVLLEPLSVGLKAVEESLRVQKSRLYDDSDVSEKEIFTNALIIGAGPIGLLTSLVLLHHKINLTVIDIDEEGGIKSNITEAMGAQYISLKRYLKGNQIDLNGLRRHEPIIEPDLMVEASGDSLTYFRLSDLLAHNGILALLGLPYGDAQHTINPNHFLTSLVLNNKVVLGSVNSNRKSFEKGKWYLEQSQKRYHHILDKIITHTLPFTKYQEAFNVRSTDRIKVVLTWG